MCGAVIVVLRGTVLCSMQLSRGVATPKTMVVDAAFGYLWCFTMVRVTSLTCFAPISLVLCPVVSCCVLLCPVACSLFACNPCLTIPP